MFDELSDLIKSDSDSQEKFKNFRTKFRKTREVQSKTELRRARTVAFILGSATIISLAFLFFAFNQKTQADRAQVEIEQLQSQLEDCREGQDE